MAAPTPTLLRFLFLFCSLLAGAKASAQQSSPDSLRIVWADVDRFWQTYDQLAQARTRADSLALVDAHYLAPATLGLRAYLEAAHATAADYLQAIRTHRRYLAAIRPAMQAVGQQQGAIRQAARKLKALYPAATFPDLYLAVGKFEVGGSAFGSALYIGAELKCATAQPLLAEVLPALRGSVSPVTAVSTACIHEIIHGQQKEQSYDTNLAGALREGAAEYLAYRLTGRLGAGQAIAYGQRHETAVRRQFAREANQPAAAKWFLALPDTANGLPGALGYFVGFRVCEAYYAQARDKQQALRHLAALDNLPELLAVGQRYLVAP
jgi:hypothetical protein